MQNLSELLSNDIKSKDSLDITVILNIWKRDHFQEQLLSLLNQTLLPKEIWVNQYENHIDLIDTINTCKQYFPNIQHIKSSKNLKYFGRFSLAINVSTTYVFMIDDDVIPGCKWLESAFEKCNFHNAIIACTGRIIPKGNYLPEQTGELDRKKYFIGDMTYLFKNYCEGDTQVDYGCNSYFFKTEWLKHYWETWPATFLSGEDIHLSATAMVNGRIKTYVIEQKDSDTCGNLKKAYGSDSVASWRQNDFTKIREEVLKYHVLKNNWQPLLW